MRLVRYLRALSTINAKTVRTLEQYKKVFWLPFDSGVVSGEQDQSDDSLWIEVKKTEKPPLPPPPEQCDKWIDKETLDNLDDFDLLKKRPSSPITAPEKGRSILVGTCRDQP